MLLQLLNSRTQIANTGEHLVMLLLKSFDLLLHLNDPLLQLGDLLQSLLVGGLGLIQMLLHIAPGCDGLDRQSLLPLQFIFKVISLRHKLVVLFFECFHLLKGFILLVLAFDSKGRLRSEHRREELCVGRNLIDILSQDFLVVPRLLEFGHVEVLESGGFVFSFFELLFELVLGVFQEFDTLLKLFYFEVFGDHVALQLFQLILLIHVILIVIVFVLVKFCVHLLIFFSKLNHLDVQFLDLLSQGSLHWVVSRKLIKFLARRE